MSPQHGWSTRTSSTILFRFSNSIAWRMRKCLNGVHSQDFKVRVREQHLVIELMMGFRLDFFHEVDVILVFNQRCKINAFKLKKNRAWDLPAKANLKPLFFVFFLFQFIVFCVLTIYLEFFRFKFPLLTGFIWVRERSGPNKRRWIWLKNKINLK